MTATTKRFAVLNTTGVDAIGYIHRVSDFLLAHNANIECQSCSQLGRLFVSSTWFQAASEHMNAINNSYMARLKDLHPQIIPMMAPLAFAGTDPEIQCTLSLLTDHDKPGIVRELARLLSQKRINISTFAAATYPAPFDGTPLFMAEMKLIVPDERILRWLASSIKAWEARFGWDLDLTIDSDDEPMMEHHMMPYPARRMFVSTRDAMADSHPSSNPLCAN